MRYEDISFTISPDVLSLGIVGAAFVAHGLSIPSHSSEFDTVLAESSPRIISEWTGERLETSAILSDFRRLHAEVGADNREAVASPESLLKFLQRKGRMPRVNLLVDIYNLISLESQLSLGAHDLSKVHGDISLRSADGNERFVPLGTSEPTAVASGEYCYIDDARDVLCRLEVRQCDKSKLNSKTTQAFFMVQGNRETGAEMIRSTTQKLIELIRHFCGGEFRMLWPKVE